MKKTVGQLGLSFEAAAKTPAATTLFTPIEVRPAAPPDDPPSGGGLSRWAVVTGPWVPEFPPGVMPVTLIERDGDEAVALSSARHNDGLDRWVIPIVDGPDPAVPMTAEQEAEFNRRANAIFEEGRPARAAMGEAPTDEEPATAPARWRRPRSPATIDPEDLGDPRDIAAEIAECLQKAQLAIGDMAAELEGGGIRMTRAGYSPMPPMKPLSKAEKLAAAQEAELHDNLIELLIPEGTKMPGLQELTACVVDGVAMLACAAGTVRLDLVLERLVRTDSTGFVLLEDIASEIARGEPLPTSMAGKIGDIMVATMTRSLKRGELENRNIERIMASVLNCSLEELPAKLAADKAEEAAQRAADKLKWEERRAVTTTDGEDGDHAPARPGGRSKKARAATTATAPVDIQAAAQRRLTPRQIELARMLNVIEDRAIYGDGKETRISDWSNVKSTVVTLGGTWQPATSKRLAGFRFPEGVDVAEVIRLAQDTGEIFDAKVVGFFPTPWGLARATASRLGILPGWRVLEPSAGSGRLAVAARELGALVFCIEPLATNRAELLRLGLELVGEDFLATDPASIDPFDGLVQNPPFADDADAIHVLHAARFVRAGGPVVSIASNGIIEHTMGKGPILRAFLAAHAGTIEKLPKGSFLESGTGVQTCVLAFATCPRCRSGACVPA